MTSVGKFDQGKVTATFAICVVLFLVYAGTRASNIVNAMQKIQVWPDTDTYTSMASQPIWSSAFLGGERPFTVPFVYKLLNSNLTMIAVAQAGFSILSWSLLAVQISKIIRSVWLKPFAFALVLLFSLSENIIGWDSVMLTESISLSLMALFLASWFYLLKDWKWQKVMLLVVVAFFWTFSRETNAWIILMVAGITTVIGVWKRPYRRYLVVAVIFVVFFCANEVSSNIGLRWEFPFLNVLAKRILPVQEQTSFFAQCGMPITPELTRMSGQWASSQNSAFYNDPALDGFRVWLHASGKSCYIRWLLSRPYQTLNDPLFNIMELLTFEGKPYFSPSFSPILPAILDRIIFPNDSFILTLLLWSNTIGIVLVIAIRAWRHNPAWVIPLSMSLLVYPHASLVWQGDAMEIGRHSLQVGVQFYLGMWIVMLLAIDYILAAKLNVAAWSKQLYHLHSPIYLIAFLIGVVLLWSRSGLGRFESNMGYLDLLKFTFSPTISSRSLESSRHLQLENSLRDFQVAVDFDNQNESAWTGQVLVSSLKGNSELAYQAVDLMPKGKSRRDYLRNWFISQSIRYLSQNEPELSEQMLLISLRLLPGVPDDRYGLQYIRIGTALLKENRTQEAGQVLERGLKVDETYNDNQAVIYAYLGKIAFDAGDFEQALKHFQMAVAIDPINALHTRWWIWDNQFHIGYILAIQGKCSQAAVAYQSALRAATEDTQIQTTQSELDRLPVSCHITGAD